ncbi:MAG: hypothetical protein VKK04_16655 [Synechococcales bacterium]|nr:hypothetical protein [Synechococcales bacterium]
MCTEKNDSEKFVWPLPESATIQPNRANPQPGEIWEVWHDLHSDGSHRGGDRPDPSDPTLSSTSGQETALPRYVMVVRDFPTLQLADLGYLLTVLVCSTETAYHSDVDVLLPAISPARRPALLGETWHICPLFSNDLRRFTGDRLPRFSYDLLLTIGDRHCGIEPAPLVTDIPPLPLLIPGPPGSHRQPHILAFHQREQVWSQAIARRSHPDLWILLKAHLLVEEAAAMEQYFLNELPEDDGEMQ